MRSLTIAALLLATAAAVSTASSPLDLVDDLIASPSSPEAATLSPPPPVKLDKNLRRALLKALVDLETESAEQHQDENSTNHPESTGHDIDENRYDFLEISKQKSTSYSFDGFPTEEDTPSEDKLQNTTFVETDKYVSGDEGNNNSRQQSSKQQQEPNDYTKGVQVHHVVPSEKASAIYETKQPGELLETVESRSITSSTSSTSSVPLPTSSSANPQQQSLIQQSVTFAPIVETLSVSASGNVASAAANSLVAPRPTAATRSINETSHSGSKIVQLAGKSNNVNTEEAEDVKIFQAPLVAAFTVQQDERGVPKNIVPLYKSGNNAQPLSLQEQLEFKQRLLEKQLYQLQAQQAQQTQFLIRQRQAYEEQVRQKQQQEYYLQEQRRLKLLQEQEQQRLRLQQQQQQQQHRPSFAQQPANIVQQQLPLPQQQNVFKQQQQQSVFKPNNVQQQQQQQSIFKPNNFVQQQQQQQQQQQIFKPNNVQQTNFNNLQQQQSTVFNNNQQSSFKTNNVQLQPSLSLEVPSTAPAAPFQQQHRAPVQQQQSFQPFPVDFQQLPAPANSATRFNRQEAFNSVGNFGFNNFQNDDKSVRQSQFVQQQRFGFNNFVQQQPQRQLVTQFATVTPARQIQDLLYQSGIAGDLQGAGTRNQEDINIVSKVLALNVGAFPNQRTIIHNQK